MMHAENVQILYTSAKVLIVLRRSKTALVIQVAMLWQTCDQVQVGMKDYFFQSDITLMIVSYASLSSLS
jgi:hypothetical protein